MEYIVGVDGGGTKTSATLADATGKVIGSGHGGPSNYQTIGLEKACHSIVTAITNAAKSAETAYGVTRSDLDKRLIVVLGLAGADRSWDKQNLKRELHARLPLNIARLIIENDARIALAGATGNQPGVVVIAGTGSIALGVNEQGQKARSGGRGPFLGDEGSGYAIGKAALTAVLREYDGRGKPTALKDKILAKLDIENPEGLIPLVYQGPLQRPEIARFAEIVLAEAIAGDHVSLAIVKAAAQELVEMIGAVIDDLGWKDEPALVAGIGGLLQPANLIWQEILTLLANSYPLADFVPPLLPPTLGAILMGRDSLTEGIALSDFADNLASSAVL